MARTSRKVTEESANRGRSERRLGDARTFNMTFIRFTASVACYFRIGKQTSITNVCDYANAVNYDFMYDHGVSCPRNRAVVERIAIVSNQFCASLRKSAGKR